jgi:hypothetical protein
MLAVMFPAIPTLINLHWYAALIQNVYMLKLTS